MEDNKNYLLFNKKGDALTYIRNNYKTHSTYGTKRNIIRNKDFILHLKKYWDLHKEMYEKGEEGTWKPVPLLLLKDGLPVKDTQVGNFVKSQTMGEIGEGSYTKIAMKHVNQRRSRASLRRISKNRGTDINTLITSYNLNSFF